MYRHIEKRYCTPHRSRHAKSLDSSGGRVASSPFLPARGLSQKFEFRPGIARNNLLWERSQVKLNRSRPSIAASVRAESITIANIAVSWLKGWSLSRTSYAGNM